MCSTAAMYEFLYPFLALSAVDVDLGHAVQELEEAGSGDFGLGVVRCVR